MFVLIITIFVFGQNGVVTSATATSAGPFATSAACEAVAKGYRGKRANSEATAMCFSTK